MTTATRKDEKRFDEAWGAPASTKGAADAHTPTPWYVERVPHAYGDLRIFFGGEGMPTAEVAYVQGAQNEADARFIVTACNSHEALISVATESLKRIDAIGQDPPYPRWAVELADDLRAALALAEKEGK